MDNEKYGIELELITNKFKQKMQEVKSAFGSISDKKINVNANTAQIEYIKSQIKEIQYLLKQADKGFEVGDTLKLEAKLEKLTNQYNKLITKQNEFKKSSANANTNITKGLDKMTSKIKRFGLALLSIRSIYALVSRASSAYLAQDTEMANRLQSAWVGLGAILAPIINFIATLILKLVSVINGFVKALTGVDLIAKASSKSMKSAAGSANSLKKALAGFDELTNLDSDMSGGGTGIGGFADAFENIDEEFSNMMQSVTTGLNNIYEEFRKKAVASIKEMQREMKKAGLSDTFINSYSLGAKGALDVLDGFIQSLTGILQIIDGLLSGSREKTLLGFENLGNGIISMLWGLFKILASVISMAISAVLDAFDYIHIGNINLFENLYDQIDKLPGSVRMGLNILLGVVEGVYNTIASIVEGLFKGIRGILDGFLAFFRGDFKGGLISIGKGIVNVFIGLINAVTSALNAVFAPIRTLVVEAGKVTGANWQMKYISIPKIPYLDVGTNYVPEDQLAFIHKGEAVVPKKYNNGGYVPQSSDETNYLLEQVIDAINNIEINPYTTVKDVGKASLSYINNKSRQLGESVVV